MRFNMTLLAEKLVRLTLLSLLIICGKSEAAADVQFEVTTEGKTLFIFGLIFLAIAVVFLIVMIMSHWCLCRRSRMLEKRTVEEYIYDESEYDELHQYIEREKTAVPTSITNQTYVQNNTQNWKLEAKDDHHDNTAFYGERQEYKESRSSYDETVNNQSQLSLIEAAVPKSSTNEPQVHKKKGDWTKRIARLCKKNRDDDDDTAVYGETHEYKETSSSYNKTKEKRDSAKKKKRLSKKDKDDDDDDDDVASSTSRQGLTTDFGENESQQHRVKNQNEFELREIALPKSSKNEAHVQKIKGDLTEKKGRLGKKDKDDDEEDRAFYGERQEYTESRSGYDETRQQHQVKIKRQGSLVPKSFTDEAYEQYNDNKKGRPGTKDDDYVDIAYHGERQGYKESRWSYDETPQQHQVKIKRKASLVPKSFSDEAYEQYNDNKKGRLGTKDDHHDDIAFYGDKREYEESRSSYDETVKIKRKGSLVPKSFTNEAYEQYNDNKKKRLGTKDDHHFYGERQEYKESRSSYDETPAQHQVKNQQQFQRKVSMVRKSSTDGARVQYNKNKGRVGKKDEHDGKVAFYGERQEYQESNPCYDKTRQQHDMWIQYQQERKEPAVPTTKSFTNEAYVKHTKDNHVYDDRAFYGEREEYKESRSSYDETASAKYRVRHEIDQTMEFPREMKVTATVTDPFQRLVSSTFCREGDGFYHLKFMPYKTGSYKVDVRSRGKPVDGSPFTMSVVDPESTLVRMRKQQKSEETRYLVGCELDIALNSPDQDLELSCKVKGPDDELVQSSIEREEDDLHHVNFVPFIPGVYKIHVRCGGEPVENSPFLIRVDDPENGSRMTHVQSKEVRAEKVIKSEIDFALEIPYQIDVRDLGVAVLGPGDEKVTSQMDYNKDGKYHIQFVPIKPGQYKIYVRYEGELVEDAPYIVNVPEQPNQHQVNNQHQLGRKETVVPKPSTDETYVYSKTKEELITKDVDDDADIAFFRYHQVPFVKQLFSSRERPETTSMKYRVRHEIDQPMEFPREMKVIATVTDPYQRFVSSTFRREADGLHHLRFTPYKRGSYTVDIRSRGKPVEGSPFIMSVVDPESTLVRMRKRDEETRYFVGHELDLALDSPDDDFELSCLVKGPDDEHVQSSIVKEEDDLHHVKFLPYRPGLYKVHVRSGGEAVENSPFLIPVGELGNKIISTHVQTKEAQAEKVIKSEVDFVLEIPFQIDERDLVATVLGPGDEKVASQLDKGKDGKYHIIFVPNKPAQYKIYVRYGGELVEDAPYIVNLTDQPQQQLVKNQSQLECKETATTKYYQNETNVHYKKKKGTNHYSDIAF